MKEAINEKRPLFNTERSQKFKKVMTELRDSPENEIEERRNSELNVRDIKEFIPEHLVNQWLEAKTRFVKAYYFWKEVLMEAPFSKFTALHVFMTMYYKKLSEAILFAAESGETNSSSIYPKEKIFKSRHFQDLPRLTIESLIWKSRML